MREELQFSTFCLTAFFCCNEASQSPANGVFKSTELEVLEFDYKFYDSPINRLLLFGWIDLLTCAIKLSLDFAQKNFFINWTKMI